MEFWNGRAHLRKFEDIHRFTAVCIAGKKECIWGILGDGVKKFVIGK